MNKEISANMAVKIENVSKFFNNRNAAPKNGSLLKNLLPFLNREKAKFYALSDINLNIKKGEIFGILGANGSGKSTLIRLISTLLIPDEGQISVFGKDVRKDELAVRRMVNRVSVEASFFKRLSPMENLSYFCRLYGYNPAEAKEKLEEIFEKLELSQDRLNDSLRKLSRGMQQKVAITRALFTSPSILLLDEPTTGLDPRSKLQVQEFVRRINKEDGITVLLTTHDMAEAERLCNRLAIMKEGKIIIEGTPDQLKNEVLGGDGNDMTRATLEEVYLKLAEEGQ